MRGSSSLVRRLLLTLIGALTAVAILLGAGGALLIDTIVETTADRLLGASARAIAETLAVEDGEITLDLPPFALGMLENNARDNVYYNVRHDGRLITGYPDLPVLPTPEADTGESAFGYARFRGARIRIGAEARTLPRVHGVIVVEVAETLDSRTDLANRMLAGLAALEAVLVGVAVILVWPVVGWSLRPVTRLRGHLDSRAALQIDFAPLPTAGVPSELTGLVGGFNDLLSRLESSVAGMRRFTADASHQMRTPLAILRAHLAVLKKQGTQTEAGRNSLQDVEHATNRLQRLLTGLISLARTEHLSDDAPITDEIDVREVMRQVATEHRPFAKQRKVNLKVEPSREATIARTEFLALSELLGNLVDNAIRYNRSGGWVAIRAGMEDGGAVLEVEDGGPGVPAAEREKIFDRFYRLPRDQQREGSGLGLSIVHALAVRLNATLEIEGDNGMLFRVRLPP